MVAEVGALGKHLALVGFMGAGKTTIGREVALRTERPFVDTDEEIERHFGPIPQLFDERGEAGFRELEKQVVVEALESRNPAVVALGGGAILSEATRELLRRRAHAVHLVVDETEAWARVAGGDRPLARSRETFGRLFAERREAYAEVADAIARDVHDVLLAALAVTVARDGMGASAAGDAVIADERVLDLHPLDVAAPVLTVPSGEAAKRPEVVERLWNALELERGGTLLAYGGGATTDVAGFVAATYKRGVAWIALPTTLVGQVDAAIGGKTGIDVAGGKNLVGAFHVPRAVIADPALLMTLPEAERRQGLAEVVKTGLLAGEPYWELEDEPMVRACAAFKCAIVLSDPYEHGRRAILNLGHTFGHALEAASGYTLRHGDAVALGLLAALRLSGQPTDSVEEVLGPQPVRVDRERAWAALKRDKKASGGRTRLVLLEAPGRPAYGVELPDRNVRAALDALIAG